MISVEVMDNHTICCDMTWTLKFENSCFFSMGCHDNSHASYGAHGFKTVIFEKPNILTKPNAGIAWMINLF